MLLKPNKRKIDEINDAIEAVDLPEDWFETLVHAEDLPLIVAHLCNKARIPTSHVKKTRIELPSSRKTTWGRIVEEFDDVPFELSDLDHCITPVYLLPPSFHTSLYLSAWQAQDIYQEKCAQTREAMRLRILEPYILPVLSLFHGRVVDISAQDIGGLSKGDVEHKIVVVQGILFLVMELKVDLNAENNVAELFAELHDAAEINSEKELADLPVYGLLTDLSRFEFYSYEPKKRRFVLDEKILTENSRPLFGFSMIQVINKIFSVVITAYVGVLSDMVSSEQEEEEETGDTEASGSSPSEQLSTRGQPSQTSDWESALQLANKSIAKFKEPYTTIEDIETNGKAALALLTQSVSLIPRKYDHSASGDVHSLAAGVVNKWHAQKVKFPDNVPSLELLITG